MPPQIAMTQSSEQPLLERLSSRLLPELKKYLAQHRSAVEAAILESPPDQAVAAGRSYSKVYDGLISSLFHAARIAMMQEGKWQPVSVGAVGSYGRGVPSPCSDLDVRFLCERDVDRAGPVAEALLYPLWDAGVSLGHQILTPDEMVELAGTDLPTATSLLDWRTITGDVVLAEGMLERAFQGVFGPGGIGHFLERLEAVGEERRERFGGSVFLLEPDVRNGAGGLRDLDLARWAARARWRVGDLDDLVRVGVLVPRELSQIRTSRNFLTHVRHLLHLAAGRRADRLTFDEQERLAEKLAYGSGGPGVERFMSEYYRHARAISRAQGTILSRAAPPPKRRPVEQLIGGGLKITRGAVSLVDPDSLEETPALALRLLDTAVRRNLPVYDFAREAVARATTSKTFCRRLRESPEAAELFVRLCCVVQRTRLTKGSPLQDMHDVGLLLAMVPEFAPVVGRVHHDIYHVYTVDVHSIAAVDRLRALCRGDLAAEHPLACRLAAEIARPKVLFFATLLHDVGKDLGGRNHSERGRDMARGILERLRFDEADIVEVQHLVLKHLRMYHVATRRDIDDPRTLEEFTREVHGPEGLRELYLVTVADLSTTSPTAMTSWKARMLDELYVSADRYLSAGGTSRDARRTEAVRQEILKLWPTDEAQSYVEDFLTALPERYLYANDPRWVVRQALFARSVRELPADITVLNTANPYVELAVVADDRPGLLAMITAAFSHSKLKVVAAQIYSWIGRDGRSRALDIFWVRSGQEAELTVRLLPRLKKDLMRVIQGEIDPVELATGRPAQARWTLRPTPPVATKVNIDNRAATDHTVVEVITRDRRDLLFWISTTLQELGLSISLAKVNTEGERVADVFYVTDPSGGKLTAPEKIEDLRQRILSTIARIERETAA